MLECCLCFFFFFQAEDGIRDLYVTGVQTCALPIWPPWRTPVHGIRHQPGEPDVDYSIVPGYAAESREGMYPIRHRMSRRSNRDSAAAFESAANSGDRKSVV